MPERCMWIQTYRQDKDNEYNNKEKAIALADMLAGKFSTVMLTSRVRGSNRVVFNSELTRVREEYTVDGMSGGAHLAQLLVDRGINVELWIFVHFLITYSEMYTPPKPEWNIKSLPSFDTTMPNFSIPGMRQLIADHVIDLVVSNPAVSGAHLDYLRVKNKLLDRDDLPITAEHLTEVARLIRAGIGPNKTLSAYFSGRGANMAHRQRRDVWTWLSEKDLFNRLKMGSYVTEPLESRYQWLLSLPNNEKILPGIPAFTRAGKPADEGSAYVNLASHTEWWNARDMLDHAVFDSSTFTQEMADWLPQFELPEPEPDPPPWQPDWAQITQIKRRQAVHYRALADLCTDEANLFIPK